MSVFINDGEAVPGHQLLSSQANRLVLDSKFDEMDQLLAQAWSLTPCLEYSAQLGKHAVTQFLVSRNVPISRMAVVNAARKRGPGVALLLAGLAAEDLARASSVGLTFSMEVGNFTKAFEMLGRGVKPDRNSISAAFDGAFQRSPNREYAAFHEALGQLLPAIAKDVLAESHLEFVVKAGRPVHIERVLEKLAQPVSFLMPIVFSLSGEIYSTKLREFGAIVDDKAFKYCANHLTSNAKSQPAQYLERLCRFAVADGYEGRIHLFRMQPILDAYMDKYASWLSMGYQSNPNSFEHFRLTLGVVIPCILPDERVGLHTYFDRWNHGKPAQLILREDGLAQIHQLIDSTSIETMDLRHGGFGL